MFMKDLARLSKAEAYRVIMALKHVLDKYVNDSTGEPLKRTSRTTSRLARGAKK